VRAGDALQPEAGRRSHEKVAAIDIGTNSVLLVIAAADAAGPRPLLERATITRLGENVDRARRLLPAAAERTLDCLRAYARDLRDHGLPPLDVVGTSALRDARGASEFLDEAQRILGVRPRVIAGEEEAALTFAGALSGLELQGKLLVFDVGGGSTELILGSVSPDAPPRRILATESRTSLDIGSVRLFERHIRSDPPTRAELSAVEADIAAAFSSAGPLTSSAGSGAVLVGVAGTVTTLKAVELGLTPYDGAQVHGATLTLSAVEALCDRLSGLPLRERSQLPGLEPKRADVIVAGALIVLVLMRRAGAKEIVVSDRGVRFGLLERLLGD
jgi:exopolyphosphatase/guanosine-5'-triphosphate,3'-diphosphate pyrophosphatase